MLRQLSVEEACRKLKPIFGKKIDDIYLRYAMANSREEKDDIAHLVSALYNKNLSELLDNKILLEPPKEEDVSGEYSLATVSYARKKLYSFNLRERDWPRHVCISGMSGSGKTTFAMHILENFIKHDKSFLVFDWKKSFRPLVKASGEVVVFTIGNPLVSNNFKMNINKPPKGIDPKEWINVLCDLLVESFSASYGVHKVLLDTIDDAFTQFGVYEGSNNYPTWSHISWYLKEKLDKAKGRESGWLESAMRIASVLTFGNFGKVVSSKNEGSLAIEDLLDKKVVLELNALSNVEKKFFSEYILTYIYKLKKANQNTVDGSFDHAILVDEAHNVFLNSTTNFTKESVTDMVYREMREYGTSLICLDQHVSKLSDTVKGNSACHVAFQQQLPQDIYDISGLMQLKDKRDYFSSLPVGSAIVKLSERYNKPFLIEVEKAKLRESDVSDEEIKNRAKSIVMGMEVESGNDSEFNKELENATPIEVSTVKHDKVYSNVAENVAEYPEKPLEEISEKEDEMGKAKNPFMPQSDNAYFTFERVDGSEKESKEKVFEIVETKTDGQEDKVVEDLDVSQESASENVDSKVVEESREEILSGYIRSELFKGRRLKDIEDELNLYCDEGNYRTSDVARAINHVLSNQLKEGDGERKVVRKSADSAVDVPVKSVATGERQKLYKAREAPKIEGNNDNLAKDEERFLTYLKNTHGDGLGTVEIYKGLGLSSRKGNKIKNQLIEKGMIRIDEVKNEKGWKKLIRLNY